MCAPRQPTHRINDAHLGDICGERGLIAEGRAQGLGEASVVPAPGLEGERTDPPVLEARKRAGDFGAIAEADGGEPLRVHARKLLGDVNRAASADHVADVPGQIVRRGALPLVS